MKRIVAEHRTSADDVAPPWYKRGAYILIIALVVFIVVYAFYLLVLAPAPPSETYVAPPLPGYSAGQNPLP